MQVYFLPLSRHQHQSSLTASWALLMRPVESVFASERRWWWKPFLQHREHYCSIQTVLSTRQAFGPLLTNPSSKHHLQSDGAGLVATEACSQLLKCACKSATGCGTRFGCRKGGWQCTRLCKCSCDNEIDQWIYTYSYHLRLPMYMPELP